MRLVVGLGNPGQEYVYTRHNMGWAVIDHMARDLGRASEKFRGEFWRLSSDCVLLKPTTFMNLSGFAVRDVFDFYKLDVSDVLVVCDETALPFGKLRLRAKGSAGGHKGLASVLACLGSLAVPRLRIGVGDGANKISWVLGHLSSDEMSLFPDIMDRAEKGVYSWLTLGSERAMNVINAPPVDAAKNGSDM
ncbi:MAG: aminoacyl-tRNA hydrolase [Synergistaceae bacterium]|jgi:PTH1 family peptidyl-tRNA hydrolase|nr:aminoacyl-tRNA hydrolase [Synergistaceae bacterium]